MRWVFKVSTALHDSGRPAGGGLAPELLNFLECYIPDRTQL